MEKLFNIRVYAIIFDKSGQNILLSDEMVHGNCITKFPGGGLDWGEGPIDCLKREAIEEFGQEIEVLEHFYTTDFFQPAFYYENQQLISIYYRAKFLKETSFPLLEGVSDFKNCSENEKFRWFPVDKLNEEILNLPIDKVVALKIKNIFNGKS